MKDIEIPLEKEKTFKYRFFEMLPAIMSYIVILLPIVLSIINPLLGAIFILGYIIMWFVKAIAMAYRTVRGYNLLKRARAINWRSRLDDLENIDKALDDYHVSDHKREWNSTKHYRNLCKVAAERDRYYKPSDVYNVIIIPMYKESREIVRESLQSIVDSDCDLSRVMIIIGYEERAGAEYGEVARDMKKEFKDNFLDFEVIMHPFGIPNEVIGKGGNIQYAAKNSLEKTIKKMKIDPDCVIVTTIDADNKLDPSFISYLTYEYILDTEHKYRAYQPISLYMSNIWDVPAPMRVLATGNSFWTIINAQRPHMLRNFSAHAQGMSSLIETDYWSVRTIVEDGHQYWRSYFSFDGNYEVTPIYVPIHQDAVLDVSYWKTLKAQFLQLRRWAYGASDVAYVADKGFRKDSKIPFFEFFSRFFRLLESHVSWATASIIIAFGAWAPLFLNSEANRSIVAHELPMIASRLQQVAMIGLFISVFLAFKMLPPRPARYKKHRSVFMILQWAIMPITSIVYGSAAAFYSQTRLLLGKYLDEFDVTHKGFKKD